MCAQNQQPNNIKPTHKQMNRGFISEATSAGRIVSAGEVKDLSNAFSLPGGEVFTLYLRPKQADDDSVDAMLMVKPYQGDEYVSLPFPVGDWSPILVRKLSRENAYLLERFRIFWGSGAYVNQD